MILSDRRFTLDQPTPIPGVARELKRLSAVRRRTLRLPDDLTVTILRLTGSLTVAVLRTMLAADWYALLGRTFSPDGSPTGYGAYIGTSDALAAQTARAGVSLRTWSYKYGRLQPNTVVLIRRAARPARNNPRLLVEACIARAVSGAGYTILNTRTAAPTAAAAASRNERLWANEVADRLAGQIIGRVLAAHPPRARGGSTREQLVRLILNQNPPRGMDVDDLLAAARAAGIPIAGATPQQRTRRDVTTRELSTGRPRIYRTWIRGRTVVYPAGMPVSQARSTYRIRIPNRAAAGQRATPIVHVAHQRATGLAATTGAPTGLP